MHSTDTVPGVDGVSFWEWVAMYGLDGIGGGVLGGIVAWLLLRRTIAHERHQLLGTKVDSRSAEFVVALRRLHVALNEMGTQPGAAMVEDTGVKFEALMKGARMVRAELLFVEIAARSASEWDMALQLNDLRIQLEETAAEDHPLKANTLLRQYEAHAESIVLNMIAMLLTQPINDRPPKDRVGG